MKLAEEMFGTMRHSTKDEADAYEAMLKSMSVELEPLEVSMTGGSEVDGFVSNEVAGLRVTVGWLVGVVMGFAVGCVFWAFVVG